MPEVTLRRAVPEDAAALSVCIDAAYEIYKTRLSDLPAVSDGLVEDIEQRCVWVADVDGEIVGGIILAPGEDHLLIANIAVHPEHAGQGVGRNLLERAETRCVVLGLCELRLNTHAALSENISLYTHLGWIEDGRSGNRVRMKKSVS